MNMEVTSSKKSLYIYILLYFTHTVQLQNISLHYKSNEVVWIREYKLIQSPFPIRAA